MSRPKDAKGTFSSVALPVAQSYPKLPGRRRLLLIGGLGVLGLAAYLLQDSVVGRGAFVSNGPLSSAHGNLESDCESCHTPLAGVSKTTGLDNAKCLACHERHTDKAGGLSFAAHYVYRSSVPERAVDAELEVGCEVCHTEHHGRTALIARVADIQCINCHGFASFNSGHPDFGSGAASTEDASLGFTHISHVRDVMKREEAVDIERACLYCHNPREDGRNFASISFDQHCAACHLTETITTAALPVMSSDAPGVETLEMIAGSRAPGSTWAWFADPSEYRTSATSVRKGPVRHRDPWITHNMRRLRQILYPDVGAEPADRGDERYEEALKPLRRQLIELRSQPPSKVQERLRGIEALVAHVEQELAGPSLLPDEASSLGAEERAGLESLVNDLTAVCQVCHQVEQATIAPVVADQRTMTRAEFNHRAHIIGRRCVDCHNQIPFESKLHGARSVDPEVDGAQIVNLPSAAGCADCHNARQVSNRCVTCHLFHPDKQP